MKCNIVFFFVWILKEVFDPFTIKGTDTSNDTVHLIAFFDQELGKV